MDKNVETLCCDKVKAVEYFELLVMRYSDMKVACEIVHFKKLLTAVLLINLNTYKIFRTRYSVPEAGLGLPELLRFGSRQITQQRTSS